MIKSNSIYITIKGVKAFITYIKSMTDTKLYEDESLDYLHLADEYLKKRKENLGY